MPAPASPTKGKRALRTDLASILTAFSQLLENQKSINNSETGQVVELLLREFKLVQSAAGSLMDSMASPTKSPRKSPSKVKENEEPLQDCTPISMSFSSPAKKRSIDDKYL